MNQNMQVRQISQEEVDIARGVKQQMTPEELQRTQVLNFQDVEDLANFEKRTSKKPAIIIAILGIISITFTNYHTFIYFSTWFYEHCSPIFKITN